MSGKPRERPRTLSEKLSERDLQQGRLVSSRRASEPILHGASLQFCLSWGDDGYDPLRKELVALFQTREDFEIAKRRKLMPDGQNCILGESAMVQHLEIPYHRLDNNASDCVAYVVIETVYEGYSDYNHWVENDHSNYLVDGSGVPLMAFGCHLAAAEYAEKLLAALLRNSVEIQERFWRFAGVDWESLSSLSRYDFSMALEALGIDIGPEDWESDLFAATLALNIALGVDVRDTFKKINIGIAQKDRATKVLDLLDRFRFFKIVTMPIWQFEEF